MLPSRTETAAPIRAAIAVGQPSRLWASSRRWSPALNSRRRETAPGSRRITSQRDLNWGWSFCWYSSQVMPRARANTS